MVKLSVISQREVGDTLLDRSRFKHEPTSTFPAILLRLFMLKNAAVLDFSSRHGAEKS